MKRIRVAERSNWKKTAELMGFNFHTINGERYWDESSYYQFTLDQIEKDIEDPTQEIHSMCLDLVEDIVKSEQLLSMLAIPSAYHDLVRDSWCQGHPHLYGRMDFSYAGKGPAKLLELNYDTPTSIYEASVFQWVWIEEMIASGTIPERSDQYNSIEETLLKTFFSMKDIGVEGDFHFSGTIHSEEDKATVKYLKDIAAQAGYRTHFVGLEEIGINENRLFVDQHDRPIDNLFKLHAWEHIFREAFGIWVEGSSTQFVEPAWKAILSNKGFLPMLWDKHKNHPNLLASYFDPDPSKQLSAGWVRKPFFSREGANIEIVDNNGAKTFQDGPYTDSPYIIQKFDPLPKFEESYTLIGSWVVGDKACGIGIREDDSLITKDTSRFVPHIILD